MQIIVAGMHRSGTSLVTRLINMLGVYVGAAECTLPADADNPTGYWERGDVMTINDALLATRGCAWDRVAGWSPPAPVPALAARGLRGVVREMDSHRPWVIKDPRLCLTLTQWAPFLETPVVVVVYRDPRHIARSLQRRDAMPIAYAFALWEFYLVSLLNATRGMSCIHVAAGDAVARPIRFVRSLRAALEARGVVGLRTPSDDEVLRFVNPRLDHSAGCVEPLSRRHQRLAAMMAGARKPRGHVRVSDGALAVLATRQA